MIRWVTWVSHVTVTGVKQNMEGCLRLGSGDTDTASEELMNFNFFCFFIINVLLFISQFRNWNCIIIVVSHALTYTRTFLAAHRPLTLVIQGEGESTLSACWEICCVHMSICTHSLCLC